MRRTLHILAVVIIIVLAVGLYKAKTDAAKTEAHVRQLESQITDAEADMRALRAEIAHLESPARIENLAEQHLGLNEAPQPLPESAMDARLPAPREPARQERRAP